MTTTSTAPKSAIQIIEHYRELQIAGKTIICPYFINTKEGYNPGLRVLMGKGDPDEIEREVSVAAQIKGINLRKLSATELRRFMLERSIGIDCSGFVVHVLDTWLAGQGDYHLLHYLKFKRNSPLDYLRRALRPVQNIGADDITSDLNCIAINDLNLIQPGDLIRSKGKRRNAHHVLLITKVMREGEHVKTFEYYGSAREYAEENGVRPGLVTITHPDKGLKEQQWHDIYQDRNWTYEELLINYEDNGVRRLKALDLKFLTSD